VRRIVFAPSFDSELLEISISIEQRFGARAADEFEVRIRATAQILANTPMAGTRQHGYPTRLYAFVQSPNWLFYRFTDAEVHFLHIRDGRRDRRRQTFAN
jgi:plasmid stabilization system protein ParE